MAINADAARTLVGILGNIISFCLFLSPVPTFLKIHKEKSVMAFKPHPYTATFLNCAMWMLYGMPFVNPDSLLVITINGAGLIIEAIYISIFFIYSDQAKRRKLTITVLLELVFVFILVIITVVIIHEPKQRQTLVGILCIGFNIIMYASPLTVMKQVITTKSVKYMPLPLSLANLANGIVWSSYALIKFDPFILIPNGLGCFSGIVQLGLYVTYYKTTNWDEDDTAQSDIEMQGPGRA